MKDAVRGLTGAMLRVDLDATRAGYTWSAWGENIAAGYTSVSAVMQGWIASGNSARPISGPVNCRLLARSSSRGFRGSRACSAC